MSDDDWAVVLSVVAILISLASLVVGWFNMRDLKRAERLLDPTRPTRPAKLKDIT